LTKQISALDPYAQAFDIWLARTNELISAANTEFMTANTNANGSVTVGNVYLSGILYSTVLATSELRGGNVQSSDTLSVTSNVALGETLNFSIGNTSVNVQVNSSSLVIGGKTVEPMLAQINVQTTGTTSQLVDSFQKTEYRGAEYILTVRDNAANNFHMSKALVFHDSGADAYITEYGTMSSNNHLGILSANANTTHVRLYLTPTVANTQVKATRTGVSI